MKHLNDPDGIRLPIKLDTTSNGEFEPIPLFKANKVANQTAMENVTCNAKRRGMNRRNFLVSLCGAASALLAFNEVNAAARKTGGYFEMAPSAGADQEAAAASLEARSGVRVKGQSKPPASVYATTPIYSVPLL
jgi:hypothetical protein